MTEDITTSFHNLLVNQGVYGKIKDIAPDTFRRLISDSTTLDLYCPICKENKTYVKISFNYLDGFEYYLNENNNYNPSLSCQIYKCPTCNKKLFYLFYYREKEIIKLAQYPTLYDVSRDELKIYQKNELIDKDSFSQLYKAETCASSGYFVAAYTYMRRVYETLLMSVFTQNQDEIGLSEEDFRKLRSDEKLKTIKDYLAIDDEIYLPLYSLLSAGIHAMSEEQCCEDYTVLKPILLDILAEQKVKKEKAAKRKELKESYAKRKGEMK